MTTPQPSRLTPQTQQRLVQRCVVDFLLGQIGRLHRLHGDLVGGAVYLAIKQATAVAQKPNGSEAPPRAISVRAVAQSLGFSYETTRRRVMSLEQAGLVRRLGEAGVAAVPGAIESKAYREAAAATHVAELALYASLAKLGIVLPDPPRGPAIDKAELDIAVAALCEDFLLRVIEIGAVPHASSMAGLVLAAMVSANADPITYDPELAVRYGRADTPPPDSVRRPATITEIGVRLGMPHEVARRRVLGLIDRGYARRVTGGYMVNMEVLQSPQMMESAMMMTQRFVQMTQGLLALGVHPNGGPTP